MDSLSFGQYLVQLRKKDAIRQWELADMASLSNTTISRIETDSVKPDSITLEKLAQALKVDKALLLTKCGYSVEQ